MSDAFLEVYAYDGSAAIFGLAAFILPRRFHRVGKDLWVVEFTKEAKSIFFVEQSRRRLYQRSYEDRLHRVAGRYGAGSLFTIKPGAIVVDVGANVGEFALYAAQSGASRVIAVEPDKRNLHALRKNAGGAIAVVDVACGHEDANAAFYESEKSSNSSLLDPHGGSKETTVQMRRLDGLLAELGVNEIDLLKIDAQGAEPEVLGGASEILLRTQIVTVDVSPERDGASSIEACRGLLGGSGFAVKIHNKGRVIVGTRS